MSGQGSSRSFNSAEEATIVANVRRLSKVAAGDGGPSDAQIVAGVKGFAEAFDFWYTRVMREAVPAYRDLIIKRINPFIRRVECDGLGPAATAGKLVEDYNARNFVTAGGWALEELAVCLGVNTKKSTAEGIDVERFDPGTSEYHLYVLKSGLVTRNSDILKALKKNARQAETLLMQGRGSQRVKVFANYAIVAGKTSSTFEDGIRRPSSAEFWSEITGLPDPDCIELALAVAAEAGKLVRRDASAHIDAMKLLIADYIGMRDRPGVVDWEFIALRNMQDDAKWKDQDRERHQRALGKLAATGYVVAKKASRAQAPPLPEE